MSREGLEVVLGPAETFLLSSADNDGSEDEANDEEKDNKNYDDEADGEAARGGA